MQGLLTPLRCQIRYGGIPELGSREEPCPRGVLEKKTAGCDLPVVTRRMDL